MQTQGLKVSRLKILGAIHHETEGNLQLNKSLEATGLLAFYKLPMV